jgi:hypothetical protein
MRLALRSNQILVLAMLAILTLFVVGLVAFSTLAHINLWHAFTTFDYNPNAIWPNV